jgi:O-antigen biosynthesis protein WbqP
LNGVGARASSCETVETVRARLRPWGYLAFKRGLDTVVAGVALIVLSPFIALIMLAIRLDSPGPAIFRQQRIGRWGRSFAMYKFRTMRQGTPEVAKDMLLRNGGMAAVTRVGAFLRRTSLDELPQLVNVALGQMSLIGPRPALYNQYDLIDARRAAGVDQVLPGITGYAQVMGREDLPLADKVAYDAYYLAHLSLWLDAKIFVLSFRALITAKGAY